MNIISGPEQLFSFTFYSVPLKPILGRARCRQGWQADGDPVCRAVYTAYPINGLVRRRLSLFLSVCPAGHCCRSMLLLTIMSSNCLQRGASGISVGIMRMSDGSDGGDRRTS